MTNDNNSQRCTWDKGTCEIACKTGETWRCCSGYIAVGQLKKANGEMLQWVIDQGCPEPIDR